MQCKKDDTESDYGFFYNFDEYDNIDKTVNINNIIIENNESKTCYKSISQKYKMIAIHSFFVFSSCFFSMFCCYKILKARISY